MTHTHTKVSVQNMERKIEAAELSKCAQQGGRCLGFPCPLGDALNVLYWGDINILWSVIGPEPWDCVGTMITAHIHIKTD